MAHADLHDATLKAIHVLWADGSCTIDLSTVRNGKGQLKFSGISNVIIPRAQPWGPSVSVNVVREPAPGTIEIELQSGDVIRVEAKSWELSLAL